jgi:hypothetical protein
MQAKKVGFEVGWAVRLDFGYSNRGPASKRRFTAYLHYHKMRDKYAKSKAINAAVAAI